jgi:hypothetical protein
MFNEPVALITDWLAVIHFESAAERAADMHEKSQAKDRGAASSACGDVARASLHEAAHAVIAHLFGFKVDRACVRTDGSGVVLYQANLDNPYELFATSIVALAAPACELLVSADQCRQFALAHGYDLLTARLYIEKFQTLAASWGLTHRTLAQMACCVVAANWSAIARTAQALRVSGELDGAAIAALCRCEN